MKSYTLLGAFLALFTSDDDLLYLSPDLIHYIQSGQEVRTVCITAGDSGRETSYWQGREEGARTAYAVMSDFPKSWTETDAGIPGHQAQSFRLQGNPDISLVFLRLPDGNLQGQGFEVTGNSSLQKLWEGSIPSIQTLINMLVHLLSDFRPERVNTLDYHHPYGDGDHSDHHSVGYFVNEALRIYESNPVLAGYIRYPVVHQMANVVGADLVAKQLAFYAYGRSDPIYPRWLERQHTVDDAPIANAGSAQVAGLNAVVTLDGSHSSNPNGGTLVYEWTQVGGPSVELIDAGTSHPLVTTSSNPDTLVFELAVDNQHTSSSPATVTVTTTRYLENIALNARVTASSSNNRAIRPTQSRRPGHGGTVEFDDGERIEVGALDNYGTAKTVETADKAFHSFIVRITAVSPSTMNVGLSEIQVFGTSVRSQYSCVTFTIFETSPAGLPSASSVGCWQNWSAWTIYRTRPDDPSTSSTESTSSTTSTAESTSTPDPTPTDDPDKDEDDDNESSSGQGWIAGAVIGPVAGLTIIGAAAFFYLRRKKPQYTAAQQHPYEGPYYGPTPKYVSPESSELPDSEYRYAPVGPASEMPGAGLAEMSATRQTYELSSMRYN
ncbi:hypothetical protein BDV12DRAFT_184505 [Aspergillus spectabilis]